MRLQQQPLQVLWFLLERAGKIVTRDEIKAILWPNDTIVEFDNAINTAIRKLRIAFCDSSDHPKYIETVARRGYRFMAAVEPLDSSADGGPEIGVRAYSPDAAPLQAISSAGLTGKTVSHYRVLEVIGGGGMGVIYKAEDLRLDRAVALKFLPEDMVSDPRALERFEREARAASTLDHPNICSIYEFGEHEGQPFIVMQLLQGQTIRDLLATEPAGQRALPSPQLLDLAIQIGRGLQAAHEKGIIHRDIKPANIFVTTNGVTKILDFGLAKVFETGEEKELGAPVGEDAMLANIPAGTATGLSLSRHGSAIGTAGYMSPEQVRGEPLDVRTDLFSLGLVLYEMATGRRTFTGETLAAVRDAILHETPMPISDLNSSISPKMEAVINRALEKERERRYQSAAELLVDLEAIRQITSDAEYPRRSRVRDKKVLTAGVLVVAALAALVYWRLHKPVPNLSPRGTIVLADFANTTGEKVFDDSLQQALTLQLEQSPFLNVVSARTIRATLQEMEKPPEQPITAEVAAEICLRTHSNAVLAGSIAPNNNGYDVTLKALSCQTGHPFEVVELRAKNRNKILQALDAASSQMRQRLGESIASVQKFDQPLLEATTSSLEALQAYSKMRRFGSPTETIPYLKRAIELDPNFGLAYARLGAAYWSVGQGKLGAQNITKAYELRDHVSQRERFYIETTYYALVTRELEKAAQSAREWAQSYPGDAKPLNALAVIYSQLGKPEDAIREMEGAVQLAPENPGAYANLVGMASAANRLSLAQDTYDKARTLNLDSASLREYKYNLAFLQGDEAGMREQLQWAVGKPRTEDVLLSAQSATEAYYGRIKNARQYSRRAVESALRSDAAETASIKTGYEAIREAELGNSAIAQRLAQDALGQDPGRDGRVWAAIAFARSGNVERAKALSQGLNQEFPLDTLLQNETLPCIRAAIDLYHNMPLQALEVLEVSRPYEMTQDSLTYMYPAYLRGEAYLKMGQGERAVFEYRKLVEHPGIVGNFVTGALVHLQLGRAEMLAGNREAAKRSYETFLRLWKEADPDIPVLTQAKAEYSKLR